VGRCPTWKRRRDHRVKMPVSETRCRSSMTPRIAPVAPTAHAGIRAPRKDARTPSGPRRRDCHKDRGPEDPLAQARTSSETCATAATGPHGMTTTPHELHRLAAFTDDPRGGNPAGVWIGDALPPADRMQRIAAEVGYSETAFLAPASGDAWEVRYFSPLAEVPFCGHATIASGVVLGRRYGSGNYR